MKTHSLSFISLISTLALPVLEAAPVPELRPILAQPDQIILQNDFSTPDQLKKEHWRPSMGTQWVVADGLLKGAPSTPEYQKSKKDHNGYEPRIIAALTPKQCIVQFSVRFTEGSETPVVPFVEFDHHVARIKFSKESVFMLADHDSLKVSESAELKYEPGRWYHCLAEVKGEECVVQFSGGPTLYGKHPSYSQAPPSGSPGMGVTGPKGGFVEIDNVTIWSIKPEEQSSWAVRRERFPKFEPKPYSLTQGKGAKKDETDSK